jgi:tight adherence protein C
MDTTLLLIVAAVMAFGGGIVLFLLDGSGEKPKAGLEARLAGLEIDLSNATIDEVELAMPFQQRILRPVVDRIGRLITKRTPRQRLQQLELLIATSGSKMSPGTLMTLQLIGPFIGGAVGFGLVQFAGMDGGTAIAIPAGGAIFGYLYPVLALKGKVKKRGKEMLLSMPNVLDLITVCVESGQTFEAALMKVTEKYKGPLIDEYAKVMSEIRLGRPRSEALEAMAERCKVDEVTNFSRAIIQMEQLGVGMGNVMRIQSEELRRARKQRAQEQGAKVPVKMLLPMVGCIFPVIFIVLMGPAVITVLMPTGGQ